MFRTVCFFAIIFRCIKADGQQSEDIVPNFHSDYQQYLPRLFGVVDVKLFLILNEVSVVSSAPAVRVAFLSIQNDDLFNPRVLCPFALVWRCDLCSFIIGVRMLGGADVVGREIPSYRLQLHR